jgi:putative transcription factor
MICEMCGAEVPKLRKVTIEGSNLGVCQNCAKFGMDGTATKGGEDSLATTTIDKRLLKREKRLQTRDVLETNQKELALDYPKRIRKARASMGLSQEELGKKINEKKSVVAKLETGDMVPDDKLVKKLERALDISLMEELSRVSPPKSREERRGMTLGDFIKIEE